jgi:nicotinamidase-related amidase
MALLILRFYLEVGSRTLAVTAGGQDRGDTLIDGMKGKLHAWRIEDREYARQEERRGRRHAFETLEPVRTALVVIDMVPFFVSDSGYCLGIVPNISDIAAALRKAGGTVAWVVPSPAEHVAATEEFYGPKAAAMYRRSGGEGPVAGRLWEGFGVHSDDLLAEKTASSAFFPGRCPLPSLLEARGITTVLITGTVTNVCCESSARDASTLGYRVIMVADANAAIRDQDHNATLHTIYRSFGDVRPTAEVIGMIKPAAK